MATKDKNLNNAAAFSFTSVKITLEDGKNKGKTFQIREIINGFTYYEAVSYTHLTLPTMFEV